jgi:hypothetical protein
MSGGVTRCHVLPWLRVTWMRPSSEPAQITSRSSGDSPTEKMFAKYSMLVWSLVIGPPESPSVSGSARVRSGLIRRQLWPSLVVTNRCCEEAYTASGRRGVVMIGNVQWKRSLRSLAGCPIGLSGQMLMLRVCSVRRSNRDR